MKIVVLNGGTSTERDVSLVSGAGVYKALKKKGHQVVLMDIFLGLELTEEEKKNIFELDRDFSEGIGSVSENRTDINDIKAKRKNPEDGFFGPNVLDVCKMCDIVFLALHGMNGEDGRVQATLDLMNIKYTGTDYMSSALAMDKSITKTLFNGNDIPTPYGFQLKKGQKVPDAITYPCIIKTSHGGSSIGVYVVNKEEEFDSALEEAYSIEEEVVIEQYVKGDEYTQLVLDGEAYPIVKITPKVGGYDYKNKYQAGSTEEICPAPISKELTDRISEIAVRAYKALRLQVYARVDFIVDKDENIFCLEANTLPGMTPTSLIPQEAAAAGIGYEDLCELLINKSLEKYK